MGSGIHSHKEQMVCGFFEEPDRISVLWAAERKNSCIRGLQSRHAGPSAPASCVFLLRKMEGHALNWKARHLSSTLA